MTGVEEMLALWREERTALNPGATADALSRLEQLLGVPLPADLQAFYSMADGMPDYEYDACHLSFWSIDRILREHAERLPFRPGHDREIAFADFLIDSHFYFYRVSAGGHLRVGHDLDEADEEQSLEALFRRYLDRPQDMPVLIDGRPPRAAG